MEVVRCLLNEAKWRIYALIYQTIIGSDNVCSPVRHQAIIWTNAGLLLIGPMDIFQRNVKQNTTIFIVENPFENVVWKMSTPCPLSRPQCVNAGNWYVYGQEALCIHIFMFFIDIPHDDKD